MCRIFCQSINNIPQSGQSLVNFAGFFQPITGSTSFRLPFTASQIYQIQLGNLEKKRLSPWIHPKYHNNTLTDFFSVSAISMWIWKIACDLELCSFMLVTAVVRLRLPIFIAFNISAALLHVCECKWETKTPCPLVSLNSKGLVFLIFNKSLKE